MAPQTQQDFQTFVSDCPVLSEVLLVQWTVLASGQAVVAAVGQQVVVVA